MNHTRLSCTWFNYSWLWHSLFILKLRKDKNTNKNTSSLLFCSKHAEPPIPNAYQMLIILTNILNRLIRIDTCLLDTTLLMTQQRPQQTTIKRGMIYYRGIHDTRATECHHGPIILGMLSTAICILRVAFYKLWHLVFVCLCLKARPPLLSAVKEQKAVS